MTIKNTEETLETLWQMLLTTYRTYNAAAPDKWEEPYYLGELEQALDEQGVWESAEGSLMAVNNNELIFSSWKGTPMGDLNLLLDVLDKYPDLRVVPLGKYFHDLVFLMNTASIRKYHQHQVRCIRLDIEKYNTNNLREFTCPAS